MKTQVYSIFDTAAGIYQKPFFGLSDAEVRRSFMDVCTSADHPISKHPEDYSLYRLGSFDDNTGIITDEKNECLCTAHEIIAQSQSIPSGSLLNGTNESVMPASPGLTD